MSETYDIIIAGGGVSGILLANRVALQNPEQRVLLIEKESYIGGRIRDTDPESSRWSYGLNRVSPELYEFLQQTIRGVSHADDLEEFHRGSSKSIGVLAAHKVQSVELDQMFTKKGARLVGGAAAARDWTLVDDLLSKGESGDSQQSVANLWKSKRNAPSAIVLEHLARAVGIANVWQSSAGALNERVGRYTNEGIDGDWGKLLLQLIQSEDNEFLPNLSVVTDSTIVDAQFDEESSQWDIQTSRGGFQGRALAVCQSPWDAIRWLPKAHWPTELLHVVNKAKPVSLLTLTETLDGIQDIPETIIVPAEDTQVVVRADFKEVTFQATLDFELSLQAPAVVKAVKKLKRARRKFLATYPDAKLSGDHLALQPVGWSQPISASDFRYMKKLENYKFNQSHLIFCGDAYGNSYCGEKNTIRSVLAACEGLTKTAPEAHAP